MLYAVIALGIAVVALGVAVYRLAKRQNEDHLRLNLTEISADGAQDCLYSVLNMLKDAGIVDHRFVDEDEEDRSGFLN